MTAPVGAPAGHRLARSTAVMTVFTAVSRATGFVRVVVAAAVLGTTYLGDTYQSANTIPNILFELVAAGVLQAVLIPSLVSHLDRGDRQGAQHVAGAVLGLSVALLGALAAVGALAAPLLARGLFAGADAAVRDDQIRLGTVFLWIFLPQVVMYASGMVATSVLNAQDRFAVPVFAPVLNNVVVTACYGLFWVLRDGDGSLDLSALEVLVLAGGTTLGVVVFSTLPVLAARRTGFRLRPNLDHRHPEVRRLARLGAWAALFLAVTQVLLLVVLVLANRVQGAVVAYNVALTFFLLPHALFSLPVLTTLFPAMSRQSAERDWAGFGRSLERGVSTIALFVLPSAAFLTALAPWLSEALLFGRTGADGRAQVTALLVALAPGVFPYGVFLFLSRSFYARGDTRTPALVNVAVAVGGAVLMVVGFAVTNGTLRVPAVGAAHTVAYTCGAVGLFAIARHRLPAAHRPRPGRGLLAPLAGALVAGALMAGAVAVLGPQGRAGALLGLAGAGAAGAVAHLVVTAALGGPRPSQLVGLLRGRRG